MPQPFPLTSPQVTQAKATSPKTTVTSTSGVVPALLMLGRYEDRVERKGLQGRVGLAGRLVPKDLLELRGHKERREPRALREQQELPDQVDRKVTLGRWELLELQGLPARLVQHHGVGLRVNLPLLLLGQMPPLHVRRLGPHQPPELA